MRFLLAAPLLLALSSAADAEPFARAGEWVTRDDGARVCRLTVPLIRAMVFTADMCADWQIPKPQWGETVSRHWYRCGGSWEGCKLHFEDGWRP